MYKYGTDQSIYQGSNGKRGYRRDSFAILQIGGYSPKAGVYNQSTYLSQVNAFKDLHTHTYIWFEVGGDSNKAKLVMDYFLPKVKTPKGSIVALDYEQGASGNVQANTNAVLYAMDRIAQAGYKPIYYSGKPYTYAHIDYKRILAKYPKSLWIASYADYAVRSEPLWNYFPSMDGIAIWQFTSTYKAGGLDGNVDLLGVTDNQAKPTQPIQPIQPAPSKPVNKNELLDVDGQLGAHTWAGLQRILGLPDTGNPDEATIKRLQWGIKTGRLTYKA